MIIYYKHNDEQEYLLLFIGKARHFNVYFQYVPKHTRGSYVVMPRYGYNRKPKIYSLTTVNYL